jgi:hypothetical protein
MTFNEVKKYILFFRYGFEAVIYKFYEICARKYIF